MHPLSRHPWSKSGLLIGVILGAAVVSLAGEALDNLTMRDLWQAQNNAAAIESMKRDGDLARTVELLPPPGSVVAESEIFSWEPVAGASGYRLFVGTYKGGINIGSVSTGNETMAVIDGIPQTGEPVFARLSYILNGEEAYFDTEYFTEKVSTDEPVTVREDNPFNPAPKKKR